MGGNVPFINQFSLFCREAKLSLWFQKLWCNLPTVVVVDELFSCAAYVNFKYSVIWNGWILHIAWRCLRTSWRTPSIFLILARTPSFAPATLAAIVLFVVESEFLASLFICDLILWTSVFSGFGGCMSSPIWFRKCRARQTRVRAYARTQKCKNNGGLYGFVKLEVRGSTWYSTDPRTPFPPNIS